MQTTKEFRGRDYWAVENTLYTKPSFRLRKCARLIAEMAQGRDCSLLDVGCGPGALREVLQPNIHYHGIDIAIHEPAAHFREVDTAREPIGFDDRRFDFVVAMGFFEYMGNQQKAKLEEIRQILKPGGKFVMSYINFGHCRRKVWPNYNNVRSIVGMERSLGEIFDVHACFPASHHLRQKQPGRNSLSSLQMHINFNIPVFSPMFAVEYFFICSRREQSAAADDREAAVARVG